MIPYLFALVAVVIVGLIGVMGYALYRIWTDYEEDKAQADAMKRRSLAAASQLPRPWPEPSHHKTPWKDRRVS